MVSAVVRDALDKIMAGRFNMHCQAPPVTDDKLDEWEKLLRWRDEWPIIQRLIAMARDAQEQGLHEKLDIPSRDERNDWGTLFDAFQEPYRTPAFHLLWCANELSLGRLPTFN